MAWIIMYCLLPAAALGTMVILITARANIKYRKKGVEINYWAHLNAVWRVCHKPIGTLNEKYSEAIQVDLGD